MSVGGSAGVKLGWPLGGIYWAKSGLVGPNEVLVFFFLFFFFYSFPFSFSNSIFLIAPYNYDIASDMVARDEIKNKLSVSWLRNGNNN